MTDETLSVSVVIPTWRRAPWLERCLKALERQTRHPDEVLVVGRTQDVLAQDVVSRLDRSRTFPIRWVEVHVPGHVAPVRAGLAQASGNIVAFLDDDVEPEPAWLAVSLRPFTDPAVACVGGRVVTPGAPGKVHRDVGHIRWYGKHVGNIGFVGGSEPFEVEGVMEGNSAWRTHLLRSLEFDPRLDYDDGSMYGLDLSLQAIERGMRVVYQPLAVVRNASAPRDPRLDRSDRGARVFTYSRNYSIIASRHFAGFRLVAFWAWWVLVGERGSYGLATGLYDFASRRVRFNELAESFRGKWAGARAALRR